MIKDGMLPTLLVAQTVKNPPASAGDLGSIPASGRSWRREWQPTPVFLPGEIHRQRSLVGYSPSGHKGVTKGPCCDCLTVTQLRD